LGTAATRTKPQRPLQQDQRPLQQVQTPETTTTGPTPRDHYNRTKPQRPLQQVQPPETTTTGPNPRDHYNRSKPQRPLQQVQTPETTTTGPNPRDHYNRTRDHYNRSNPQRPLQQVQTPETTTTGPNPRDHYNRSNPQRPLQQVQTPETTTTGPETTTTGPNPRDHYNRFKPQRPLQQDRAPRSRTHVAVRSEALQLVSAVKFFLVSGLTFNNRASRSLSGPIDRLRRGPPALKDPAGPAEPCKTSVDTTRVTGAVRGQAVPRRDAGRRMGRDGYLLRNRILTKLSFTFLTNRTGVKSHNEARDEGPHTCLLTFVH